MYLFPEISCKITLNLPNSQLFREILANLQQNIDDLQPINGGKSGYFSFSVMSGTICLRDRFSFVYVTPSRKEAPKIDSAKAFVPSP